MGLSQVIVTEDKYQDQRQLSADQEHKISKDDAFRKWHRSDVTGPDPIAKAIGILAIPVLAAWGVLFAIMSWALLIFLGCVRFLGNIWQKKSSS